MTDPVDIHHAKARAGKARAEGAARDAAGRLVRSDAEPELEPVPVPPEQFIGTLTWLPPPPQSIGEVTWLPPTQDLLAFPAPVMVSVGRLVATDDTPGDPFLPVAEPTGIGRVLGLSERYRSCWATNKS